MQRMSSDLVKLLGGVAARGRPGKSMDRIVPALTRRFDSAPALLCTTDRTARPSEDISIPAQSVTVKIVTSAGGTHLRT